MCLFGSTSPSYLILQSLDLAAEALAGGWPQRLAACCEAVAQLKEELAALAPGLVRPSEPLKVTLDAAALGLSGRALADRLRAGRVECEYADGRLVVLMFAPDNPPRDYARVRAAVKEAAAAGPADALPPDLPAGHPHRGQRRGDRPGGCRSLPLLRRRAGGGDPVKTQNGKMRPGPDGLGPLRIG